MTLDRERVLRAAADFLGRRPNATQDEIAAAVGVSRATLHRYFAGRAALLEALDELAVTQMHHALKTARLHEDSATARNAPVGSGVSAGVALPGAAVQPNPGYRRRQVAGWLVGHRRRDHRAVPARPAGGEFRPDLTAAWLTEAFYSLVAGAAWAIRIGRVAGRDFTHMITDLLLHESSAHDAQLAGAWRASPWRCC